MATALLGLSGCGTSSGDGRVTMTHYFDVPGGLFNKIRSVCEKHSGEPVKIAPMEQEAYKDSILVQLAGGNPPDLLSYWAGAKTQYLVDQKRLTPLDDVWSRYKLDKALPTSLTAPSSRYSGHKYLLPFDYHYVGMFYNPKVMAKAGITTMPRTWKELLADAARLKAAGITPFALGSKSEWPAEFWFDYLLLRTAGAPYRQKLMNGQASYTDPQVHKAFTLWKGLFERGYFNKNPNGIDWPDAADQVARGQAAMTLGGTWFTTHWEENGIKAGSGYDMFPFPEVTPGVPKAALGPVDGWAIGADDPHPAAAKKVLGCLAGAKAQDLMARGEGALPPNKNASLKGRTGVMQKAAREARTASAFVFNYDLATPPEMSDEGLNSLAKFVDNPSTLDQDLKDDQAAADRVFRK